MSKQFGQLFPVGGEYIPTKASAYLRPYFTERYSYWGPMSASFPLVIDAANFSDLEQADHKMFLNDVESGFTGSGYMEVGGRGSSISTYPVISYPIKSSITGDVYVHIRFISPGSSSCSLYLDGVLQSSLSFATEVSWTWGSLLLTIPDTEEHIVSLSFEIDGLLLDKIVIKDSITSPVGDGPDYSQSPYITAHARVFDLDSGSKPNNMLYIYDYKTSIEEITTENWYNFNIATLHSDYPITFNDDYYALVLSCSGVGANTLIWSTSDFTDPLSRASREI